MITQINTQVIIGKVGKHKTKLTGKVKYIGSLINW